MELQEWPNENKGVFFSLSSPVSGEMVARVAGSRGPAAAQIGPTFLSGNSIFARFISLLGNGEPAKSTPPLP